MFFKSKNSNKTVDPVLILEIESGSVACALVLISKSEKVCPVVKYYHRQSFSYDVQNSGENSRDFFNLLFNSIEKTISVVFKQIPKEERPTAVHCFSGSPIYLSQTQNIRLKEDERFKVTPKLVKQLVDEQINASVGRFSSSGSVFAGDEVDPVESKIIKMYLDGYEVPNPYKLKAKSLEIVHFSSLVSGKVTKRIEGILAGFYPDLSPSWHSIAFALFHSININPKSLANIMIVSTGGLNTEMVVIRDRIIHEIISIPFGERSITQMLQQRLNRPEAEIKSLFSLQSSVGINSSHETFLTPHLDEVKSVWSKYFNEGLSSLASDAFLPRNLLVVGHSSLCDLISGWIKDEDLSETTRSQSAINSQSLSSDFFGNKCQYLDNASAKEDIHLMAEVIFCDTIIRQGQNL